MVGELCVTIDYGSGRAFIGQYDADGYCVVKFGTWYARPLMVIIRPDGTKEIVEPQTEPNQFELR